MVKKTVVAIVGLLTLFFVCFLVSACSKGEPAVNSPGGNSEQEESISYSTRPAVDGTKDLLNEQGEVILSGFEDYDFMLKYILAQKEGLWGLYDQAGKIIIEHQYDRILNPETADGEKANGLVGIRADRYFWGALDQEGKIIIPVQYNAVGLANYKKGDRFIKVERNGQTGYVAQDGKEIVEPAWDKAYWDSTSATQDLIYVKKDNKWGGIKVKDGAALPVDWNLQPSEAIKHLPENLDYANQWDFYTHQVLNGETGIRPETVLFFHDYFSKTHPELRLLPEFSPGRPPGWSEINDFLVANIDEWPEDMLLTGEQYKKFMTRYFESDSYTPSWYGPQYKDGKYVFSGGFDTHGTLIYELIALEKSKAADGKDKWQAQIKGYYFGESDSIEDYEGRTDNGKAVWAELKKKENKGLTFREMFDKLVLNPGSILQADVEWTIEFKVNNPLEDLHFIYLSCSKGPRNEQKPPQEPQQELLIFNHYPSGYEFIESVAQLRGEVEITAEMREKFNLFARDYRWTYLPPVAGYESFFEPPNEWEDNNFGSAVFYILHYLRNPEKVSERAMQNALAILFVSRDRVNQQDMPHRAYGKSALYQDGYYSPWPEGMPDFNRMFFLLTGLKIEEQESGEVYITVRAQDYYFADSSYEPGDNEKWLAEKSKELGIPDLQAAAKLIAENKIAGIAGKQEYETTLVYNMKYTVPEDYSPRFLFNRSRWLEYDEPFAER